MSALLLTLVFGIVDFGWMINRGTLVNNASREGAREGSLNPVQADIDAAAKSALATISPADVTVTVACRKPDNSACSTFAADAASGGVVLVTVRYDHRWLTPVGRAFGPTIDLSRTTEMRIE